MRRPQQLCLKMNSATDISAITINSFYLQLVKSLQDERSGCEEALVCLSLYAVVCAAGLTEANIPKVLECTRKALSGHNYKGTAMSAAAGDGGRRRATDSQRATSRRLTIYLPLLPTAKPSALRRAFKRAHSAQHA